MPFSVFYSMTLAAALTTWSPGPNNILLLSNASKYGLKKNLKFMSGIWTGSFSLMVLCGMCSSALTSILPGIRPVMTCIGAAYLLYLSYATWRRLPPGDQADTKEPTYKMGVFLQLINVKIIIYGLTMFSSFILPYERRPLILLFYAFYLMVMGALGNIIWAFAGNILKRAYEKHYKGMNTCMALLLVWCALRVLGLL
ncbi:MAG: LysE family transporter [Lachnospiraceae bacterium]|nr:LysE family transporter [Lachnospiraceae bacterium]